VVKKGGGGKKRKRKKKKKKKGGKEGGGGGRRQIEAHDDVDRMGIVSVALRVHVFASEIREH